MIDSIASVKCMTCWNPIDLNNNFYPTQPKVILESSGPYGGLEVAFLLLCPVPQGQFHTSARISGQETQSKAKQHFWADSRFCQTINFFFPSRNVTQVYSTACQQKGDLFPLVMRFSLHKLIYNKLLMYFSRESHKQKTLCKNNLSEIQKLLFLL